MKTPFLITFLLFLNLSCSQSKTIDITEFSQKDTKNALLVDVRTPGEYNNGHIENAININWFDDNFAEQFNNINKEKTIYLYCKVGGRSAKAQAKLSSLGYTNVINLDGGYDAYSK
ncbi:rhodanese-like domain-containing protein [uncultured Maribacter sp.]|uniref:rhodanese-like domain-containing protein n=1 Tax=uncultured Maribacter sp. TaxID=431308 RepID=UPI00260E2391|nr:rhodanese-like domain-containing protein [uncultured Maribacter sp.]